MTNAFSLSDPAQFAVDVVAVGVVSLALLFGGTQSGIVMPTFTWVTGGLVLTGLCLGVLVWRYSLGNEPGVLGSHRSGYSLVLFFIGILTFGILWLGFVPPVYGSDLVYGVLTLVWTTFVLSYTG